MAYDRKLSEWWWEFRYIEKGGGYIFFRGLSRFLWGWERSAEGSFLLKFSPKGSEYVYVKSEPRVVDNDGRGWKIMCRDEEKVDVRECRYALLFRNRESASNGWRSLEVFYGTESAAIAEAERSATALPANEYAVAKILTITRATTATTTRLKDY